jgi:hypothetical protein
MTRLTSALLVLFLVCAVRPVAQVDLTGDWEVRLTTPGGPMEFHMYLDHEGSKLSGRLTSPSGEFPLTGSTEGNQIKIAWTYPDGAELLEITFAGKMVGHAIRGTANVGRLGEGAMSAERDEF